MKKIAGIVVLLFMVTATISQNRVGINTNTPLEPLDVNGNTNLRGVLKLNGNSGSAGQVLTSQGNSSSPIWQSTAYTGGGRFWCTMANNSRTTSTITGRGANWDLTTGTSQDDTIDISSQVVTGTDITVNNPGLENNYFLINRSGLYHFEGMVRIFVTTATSVTMLPRASIRMLANRPSGTDINLYLTELAMELTGNSSTGSATNQFNLGTKFTIDIYLEAGTTVAFLGGLSGLRYTSDLFAIGFSAGGYMSGHFIAE